MVTARHHVHVINVFLSQMCNTHNHICHIILPNIDNYLFKYIVQQLWAKWITFSIPVCHLLIMTLIHIVVHFLKSHLKNCLDEITSALKPKISDWRREKLPDALGSALSHLRQCFQRKHKQFLQPRHFVTPQDHSPVLRPEVCLGGMLKQLMLQ